MAAAILAVALHALILGVLPGPVVPMHRPDAPQTIVISMVEPPKPHPRPSLPPPPETKPVVQRPLTRPTRPVPTPVGEHSPPAESPVMASAAAPATPVREATPPAVPALSPAQTPAPVPIPAVPATPPATVVEPKFDAAYLNNPAPVYPSVSRRLGEQGTVLLRVHVDEQGLPTSVIVRASSGFDRLDDVALQTVRRWKFVPARRGSDPVSANVIVPIVFHLRS